MRTIVRYLLLAASLAGFFFCFTKSAYTRREVALSGNIFLLGVALQGFSLILFIFFRRDGSSPGLS